MPYIFILQLLAAPRTHAQAHYVSRVHKRARGLIRKRGVSAIYERDRAYTLDRSCTSLLRGPHESLGKKSNILDVNGASARVARAGAAWLAGRMYLRVAVFYILKSTLLSGRPLLRRRRSRVLKGSPRLTCLIIYLYLLSYNQTDSDVGADGCVDDRSSELDEGELPVVKGITRLSRNRISRFCSIRVFR